LTSDFLSDDEIGALGLKRAGRSVCISRHALLFEPGRISIGDYSRIDAFCIISAGEGGVVIGRNVHLSAYVSLQGRCAIQIGDFSTISVRCSIFSSNDDYSGATMTNPTIPDRFRGSTDAPVVIGAHAILGSAAIVLPGVRIGESACAGAESLIKSDVPDFAIMAGVPARLIGQRQSAHRILAEKFLHDCATTHSNSE
jgi:dTDP-4-amino-4,6-dideoxy-D-glucose acyltransferase